jgi:hypothetical protein
MSLEKQLVPNIGMEDRIIVGFAIRPKAGRDWRVWHLAFEQKDGTRCYRARYMARDGKDVCEFDITGKTDEQVMALADGFIKVMESELPVVVAVYQTNTTLQQWVAAVKAAV